ncbi:hypothetical protein GF351_06320 [Candidatus Woesearchaeota archaeon]|nr:hypothetical protein [Candidatus Woesearchaeota archaeon]
MIRTLLLTAVFMLGCLTTLLAVDHLMLVPQTTANTETANPGSSCLVPNPFDELPAERESPSDWVKQEKIHVYDDRVVIDLENPEWAAFTDTNSMDPVIDEHANAIQLRPSSPVQLKVGDIISYDSAYAEGTIIHRIIEIGHDGEWFCRVKGDNNPLSDPGKVRFDQIKRVLVAVIY